MNKQTLRIIETYFTRADFELESKILTSAPHLEFSHLSPDIWIKVTLEKDQNIGIQFSSPIGIELHGIISWSDQRQRIAHELKIVDEEGNEIFDTPILSQLRLYHSFNRILAVVKSPVTVKTQEQVLFLTTHVNIRELPLLVDIVVDFLDYLFTLTPIASQGIYRCLNCSEELKLAVNRCPQCDHKTPICVICYQTPKPTDKFVEMGCCQQYLHLDELENWLDKRMACPYCQFSEISYNII